MVVPGFDKALEDKEIGKEYDIHISSKEGFGPRKRELLKTIPLHVFTKHKVNPYPGAVLYLDNSLVRVITVSGARVITDFNNPLAGKDLDYKFKIKRIILEEKEKINAFFKFYFKFIPDIIIEAKKITVRGKPEMEPIISIFQKKFHEIFKKDLEFKPDEKPHQKKSNETIEKEITPK
jgi:FKBP-type peptidyl-prolyl cis-trans isomerase 2